MAQIQSLDVAAELCVLRPAAATAEELLRSMAQRAVAEGYATEGFPDALVAREGTFPTGLPLPTPAAIPHTDAEHVLRPALAVALLDPPVRFGEMGSPQRTVDCRLAVLMMVGSPEHQVAALGRVIAALQDPQWPDLLADAEDAVDLARRFSRLVD